MQKAVFVDRDGTIIEDVGYPHERDDIRFLPGVSEAIRLLNESGFKVIVITNQSGVARGYFTEETVKEVNEYIRQSLAAQKAFIDMFYYCPHHVEGIIEEYRKTCYCRKPNPGMIEQAARDFDINLEESFVIGDKSIDIGAGNRAGCKTILLGEKFQNSEEIPLKADYVAPDLYEAVKWLLKHSQQKEESA